MPPFSSPITRPPSPARLRLLIAGLAPLAASPVLPAAATPLVVRVNDWAAMPFSGNVASASAYMARVNFLRAEPGGSGRLWVCDLNGNLHIFSPAGSFASRSAELLSQATARSAYLDFNGSTSADALEKAFVPNAAGTAAPSSAPNGLFQLFTKKTGLANGLVTFEFDPSYASNGKFYTIHIESVASVGSQESEVLRKPVTTKFRASTPPAIRRPPGSTRRTLQVLEPARPS